MLKDKKIGFIITDSFYNFQKIIPKIKQLVKRGAKILPEGCALRGKYQIPIGLPDGFVGHESG